MKTFLSIAIAALLVAGAANAQNAGPAPAPGTGATPMRPGLWETTVAIETAGSNSKRTIVSRACYKPTDVADVAKVLPRQREPGMKCENRDARTSGANASWRIACSSADGTLTGAADLALTGTTYSGHADLERKKRGAKSEKVAVTLGGKWLEACK